MEINYINPENMAKPQGYSHGISVTDNPKTIYVGGQNAIDASGSLVGKYSLKEQTKQALTNIEKILSGEGAKLENVIKFNIYIAHGQNPQDGFQAFQEKWDDKVNSPTITVVFVAGFVNPDWLVEIDALAVISE